MKISIAIELTKDEERGFIDSLRENYGSSLINLSLESMDPDFRDGEIWQRDNDFSKPDPHFEMSNQRYIKWEEEQKKKEAERLRRKVIEEEDLRMLKEKHSKDPFYREVRERLSNPKEDTLDLSSVSIDDIPDLIRKYLGM